MTTVLIACVAFAAGFLSCAAVACAIVWWSFADERTEQVKSTAAEQREQRIA